MTLCVGKIVGEYQLSTTQFIDRIFITTGSSQLPSIAENPNNNGNKKFEVTLYTHPIYFLTIVSGQLEKNGEHCVVDLRVEPIFPFNKMFKGIWSWIGLTVNSLLVACCLSLLYVVELQSDLKTYVVGVVYALILFYAVSFFVASQNIYLKNKLESKIEKHKLC
jgi:hypothetical protein